jgi:hypothetical protein
MARGDPLDIIEQAESKGKNVPNYKFGPGFTAQGYYQITNPTWRDFSQAAGVDLSKYPTAMAAPREVQRAVAEQIFKKRGFQPWEAVKHLRGQEANYSVGAAPSAPAYSGSTPMTMPGSTPVASTPASGDKPATVTVQAPSGALRTYVVKGKDPGIVDKLQPGFQSSLEKMISSAPPEIQQALRIGSAYRDPEHQARLFKDAVAKYGSEQAARKWVAPPGKSQHNHGQAVDLSYASPAARQWAQANAAQYGLHFPMKHEPWHIEPVGARGGGSANTAVATSTPTATPGAVAAAPAGDVPTLPADPSQGVLADSPDPFKAIADAAEKRQEQQQAQQAAAMAANQAAAQPSPIETSRAPDPMQQPQAPIDYAGLLMPRIKRGLLADDYSSGLLGAA